MKRLSMVLFAVLFVVGASLSVTHAARSDTTASGPSLYERLGRYDGIAKFSDALIGRLATDQKLTRFFVGLSDDSKARLRQHFVDLVCNATGGPCLYVGRDMKTVHKGLNITEADWTAMLGDVTATENQFNLQQRERDDLAAILTKLKPDIVMVH